MGKSGREESKQMTRQALLEAGLAEFVERGLDAPSLDAICARAGFTRGAFYVHFDNREDFIVQLMEWVGLRFLDTIVTADSAQDSLPEAIGRFLDALLRDELPTNTLGVRFPHILEASQRLPPIRERFQRLLEEAIQRISKRVTEGQQRGELREGLDSRALAGLLVVGALGAMALRDAGVNIELKGLRDLIPSLIER